MSEKTDFVVIKKDGFVYNAIQWLVGWRTSISYNDRYGGEKPGELKSQLNELDHILHKAVTLKETDPAFAELEATIRMELLVKCRQECQRLIRTSKGVRNEAMEEMDNFLFSYVRECDGVIQGSRRVMSPVKNF